MKAALRTFLTGLSLAVALFTLIAKFAPPRGPAPVGPGQPSFEFDWGTWRLSFNDNYVFLSRFRATSVPGAAQREWGGDYGGVWRGSYRDPAGAGYLEGWRAKVPNAFVIVLGLLPVLVRWHVYARRARERRTRGFLVIQPPDPDGRGKRDSAGPSNEHR